VAVQHDSTVAHRTALIACCSRYWECQHPRAIGLRICFAASTRT
jgi:hypothetical protein